ncbi:MAG: hypothetical protein V4661_08095 [Pseudomonadota bacterium]
MNRRITMRQLAAIVVIAGVALAPLSRPVMAEAPPAGVMAAMPDELAAPSTIDGSAMDGSATDEIASGMPCCPSKAPAPSDCEKCLLMAVCMNTFFSGMSAVAIHPFLMVSSRVAPLENDSWLQSLGHAPPDHPPRILI